MNVSCIGVLNNSSLDVRRKRRIQYKKCKGRLLQNPSGVLNKSIYMNIKNTNNSKSFNESKLNRSQLISVKDITSFLKKNKELALALEESRCLAKNLQKEAFSFQLELIEMRKKLNISHNALLKCSCQKDAGFSLNVDLLSHIKNSLDQTKQTLENYVSAIISNKVKGANTGNANHFVVTSSTQTEKIQMKNKRLQANTEKYKKGKDTCLCHVSVKKQEVELKDKENQKDFSSCHISANELEEKLKHKGTETDLSLCTLSVSKLKSELKDKTIHKGLLSIKDSSMQDMTSTLKYQSNSFLVQTSKNLKERPPLSVIHDSQANYNTISKGSTIKMLSGQHLKQKKMPAFQFYKDSPSGHNKENFQKIGFFSSDVKEKERSQKEKESEKEKRVRIFSPPEVHFFNQSAEDNDEDLKLRKRTSRLCYKEPAVNRKLTKSDPTVDRRFYISPHRKETFTAKRKYNTNNITRKRKRRRAKVAPIALEDIISIVEQSFQAGLLL